MQGPGEELKFSPDKVDTMIVQAIGLLDDLDKELNTYAMRVREWYGWHFPELAKIVQDNVQFAKAVKLMGSRVNAADLDFSGILQEEVESEMKEAAVISMGTEVSDHDMLNIKSLCDQVIALSEYRGQLFDYLKSRMNAIAPNLTIMVGELVGARLIAHAGSLINLAKHPASTVQILGAEKALFRALKTKHETPKYGLIYHASLIGQAAPKFKGKISRARGLKKHLKRLNAPRHWMLDKLGGAFAPKPSPGPQKERECLPLVVMLSNRLKYALTYREVVAIVMQRLISIDGKVRTDKCYAAGFMDVISIAKTNEDFRLLYDNKGRFTLHQKRLSTSCARSGPFEPSGLESLSSSSSSATFNLKVRCMTHYWSRIYAV